MRLVPSGQMKVSVPCSTSSARTTPSIFFPLEFLCLPKSEFSVDISHSKELDRQKVGGSVLVAVQNRTKEPGGIGRFSQSLKSPSLHFCAMSLAGTSWSRVILAAT